MVGLLKDIGQYGPIAPDELKRWAASGALRPEDRVRHEDRQKWYKASAVKGLFPPEVGENLPQTLPPPTPTLPVEKWFIWLKDAQT
jgi:hypothetical protein